MNITFKTLYNIIAEISSPLLIEKDKKFDNVLNELCKYLSEKRSIFVKNRRNKNHPYNFIPLAEVIQLMKPILEPPFRYTGNIGYAQIENSPLFSLDLSKEDRSIIQKMLFDIIGKHHWGVCKLFVLNIYPNHCTESFIDKMYFINRRGKKPLLGSEDGYFYLLEGITSDKLLLSKRNKRKWIKSINKYFKEY